MDKRVWVTVDPATLHKEEPPRHACGACSGRRFWSVPERTDWVCHNCHPSALLPADRLEWALAPPIYLVAATPWTWLEVPAVPYRRRGHPEED